MKTFVLDACPACGSPAPRRRRLGDHDLHRCAQCHLVYAPEFADPADLYVDGYFSEHGQMGIDTRHPEFRPFMDYVANRRLDLLEQVVKKPGSLLDVGCGNGELLGAAKQRGWLAHGVDLVPEAVANAIADYGVDARVGLLEDAGWPERHFDVVAATHVLEHQSDGAAFLASLARWVAPGGHLLIEVPNWNSLDRRRNRDGWIGLRPLEHVAHYSPRTLAGTARRLGLRPVLLRTPCYQYPGQTVGQALKDLGLNRFEPRLRRFTVEGAQRGQPARYPSPGLRRFLSLVEKAAETTRTGVVVVMAAQVP